MHAGKGIDRCKTVRVCQQRTHGLIHLVWMSINKSANRDETCGEPGPFVEESSDFPEREVIDGNNRGTEAAHDFDGLRIERSIFLICVEFVVALRKHADAKLRRQC